MDRQTAAAAFGETILWELPIQHMAADVLRPGDTVFDVGANVGGLSVAFSRLVGPTGRVVSFECNPPIIDVCRKTLALNGADNVTLMERAVFERSGETLTFNADPSFYAAASSLVAKVAGATEISVTTIALDDVPGARPSLIKMDVEGAEYFALKGAGRLLADTQPAVILEYFRTTQPDRDPLHLLAEFGYSFYDVSTYVPVDRNRYQGMDANANVLAVPPRLASQLSYKREDSGRIAGGEIIHLDAGRWILRIGMEGDMDVPARLQATDAGGAMMALYMAPLSMLRMEANSHLVLDVKRPTDVAVTLEPIEAGAGEVRITAVDLMAVRRS
jgi:FkbM family methyltransferase